MSDKTTSQASDIVTIHLERAALLDLIKELQYLGEVNVVDEYVNKRFCRAWARTLQKALQDYDKAVQR